MAHSLKGDMAHPQHCVKDERSKTVEAHPNWVM